MIHNRERNGKEFRRGSSIVSEAIESGSSDGLVELGKCFQGSIGVKQDWEEAIRLFRRAAEEGNIHGEGELGGCYWRGLGVERNVAKGANIPRSAAEKGCWDACYCISTCYELGRGVEKKLQEAHRFYVKQKRKPTGAMGRAEKTGP